MSLHDELLATARYLARRNNNKPSDADLRRCVSTAYYALFHRLIEAAVARLLPHPDQQAVIARLFEHGKMKALCSKVIDFSQLLSKPPGQQRPAWAEPYAAVFGSVLPPELPRLAEAFRQLQESRHRADYDRSAQVTSRDARAAIGQTEAAFVDLAAVENTPVGRALLLLLLLGEPKIR
jgi:uncharacterized protein (UPF0332 family)